MNKEINFFILSDIWFLSLLYGNMMTFNLKLNNQK